MQTNFTPEQLRDPHIQEANQILRKCVHCGFCTATCPTYVLLGDELDSPRGRIYLIKNMLERGEPATAETVKHIDRCLSCLSCMTTCPSGVHYMHLIDEARVHVEKTYRRPLFDRLCATCSPSSCRVPVCSSRRCSLSQLVAAVGAACRAGWAIKRLSALLDLVPKHTPPPEIDRPARHLSGRRRASACASRCCAAACRACSIPSINAAAIRLLNRHGDRGRRDRGEACCGSLTHHMGKEEDALARARRMIDAWDEAQGRRIIITASGCGTTIKDYGHMLRLDPAYAEKAAAIAANGPRHQRISAETRPARSRGRRGRCSVAYHSACSMQHGQKIRREPKALARAGRLRGDRRAGGPSVLRLGRHLQYPPAGDRRAAARPQGRQYRDRPRPTSSPPAISAASPRSARRHDDSHPAHGRVARLGLWRAMNRRALRRSRLEG